LERVSGLYVWAALIVFFWLEAPNSFPTTLTIKTTLSDNSIAGLLALGALLPFAAGMVDLSFASIAGLAMCVGTWASIHAGGMPMAVVTLIVVVGSAGIGAASGLFVTRLGVSSLVTTLGMGTVALGLSELVTSSNTLTAQFPQSFTDLVQNYVWIVPLPAVYLVVVAAIGYFILEHAPLGRRLLAVGSNATAARLNGIKVARLQVLALAISGGVAGLAGMILAGQIGSASSETGPAYLLPAVAALFLGETQLKSRVNVWGTVLAVFLIGTGIKGFELMGAQPWVSDFFNGAVLLIAVGLAARARRLNVK
jgi:ribose transport system permease protein